VHSQCRPLGEASIRHVRNLLNGAFSRAVRWRWIGTYPVDQAQAPVQPPPDPATTHAGSGGTHHHGGVERHGLGMFVWLAMTTGARRGELCTFAGIGSNSGPAC